MIRETRKTTGRRMAENKNYESLLSGMLHLMFADGFCFNSQVFRIHYTREPSVIYLYGEWCRRKKNTEWMIEKGEAARVRDNRGKSLENVI